MDKGDEFEDSFCMDTWLHRYEIVRDYGSYVMEVCEICGDEQYFEILPDGKSDNITYLSYHLRLALLPIHPLHKHEFSDLYQNFSNYV